MGYNPWDCKESDTEHACMWIILSIGFLKTKSQSSQETALPLAARKSSFSLPHFHLKSPDLQKRISLSLPSMRG